MKVRSQIATIAALALVGLSLTVHAQDARQRLDQIEQALKGDVPRILCVDENFATAGQPTEAAFAKLAANGFRSVLNLRTAEEGVDLQRQRGLAEKSGLRYLSIPVVSSAPKPEQAAEFLGHQGQVQSPNADPVRDGQPRGSILDDLPSPGTGLA